MSKCNMSFEKCNSCKFSRNVEADLWKDGKMIFAYTIICKFTNEVLTITKCIKEA